MPSLGGPLPARSLLRRSRVVFVERQEGDGTLAPPVPPEGHIRGESRAEASPWGYRNGDHRPVRQDRETEVVHILRLKLQYPGSESGFIQIVVDDRGTGIGNADTQGVAGQSAVGPAVDPDGDALLGETARAPGAVEKPGSAGSALKHGIRSLRQPFEQKLQIGVHLIPEGGKAFLGHLPLRRDTPAPGERPTLRSRRAPPRQPPSPSSHARSWRAEGPGRPGLPEVPTGPPSTRAWGASRGRRRSPAGRAPAPGAGRPRPGTVAPAPARVGRRAEAPGRPR